MRRILADPTWEASAPRRELFRFIVEETLAGRTDRLKGFAIALAVFGRDDNFDPQTDRRLRQELGIDYLLTGNVRRGGGEFRLSTRVVDAGSGRISQGISTLLGPRVVQEWRDLDSAAREV